MSKAATKESMEELHSLLAAEFIKILRDGVKVKNEEGDIEVLTPSSAQLNVIRQFLKDNDIQAALTNPAMQGIVDSLPFDESDLPPNAVRFPQNG